MKKATQKAARRSPKQRGRPKLGTAAWTEPFLAALVLGFHVRDACAEASVHPAVVYRKRGSDPAFKAAWNEAWCTGTAALEAEATRRAYHGTLKPVFHKGRTVGDIRQYSDQLLMFLLRARTPSKYRENWTMQPAGNSSEPVKIVEIETIRAPSTLSDSTAADAG